MLREIAVLALMAGEGGGQAGRRDVRTHADRELVSEARGARRLTGAPDALDRLCVRRNERAAAPKCRPGEVLRAVPTHTPAEGAAQLAGLRRATADETGVNDLSPAVRPWHRTRML